MFCKLKNTGLEKNLSTRWQWNRKLTRFATFFFLLSVRTSLQEVRGCSPEEFLTLTNPTKWSNTLKQFVGKLNSLSIFEHFVGLASKGSKVFILQKRLSTLAETKLHKISVIYRKAILWNTHINTCFEELLYNVIFDHCCFSLNSGKFLWNAFFQKTTRLIKQIHSTLGIIYLVCAQNFPNS